ncbi:MAG: FHA domain-containing protein [Clostridium sp.]|nr:FHA domain-containing protein [Clostridium sp.]
MKMVKCINGHKYNAEKFNICPHCAGMGTKEQLAATLMDMENDVDTEEPERENQQKYEIVGRRKVVGCLICVKGAMIGEGFFLVEGPNDIGRGANMEVVLSKELTVSRKAHACITYEKKKNQYYLMAAEDKKDVLYNGRIVENPVLLDNGGDIQIGQCGLRFVAFCDKNFSWK